MRAGEFQDLPVELLDFEGAVAIVLGSGAGGAVDFIDVKGRVSYAEIPGLPVSSVPGHAGFLLWGTIAGEKVLVGQGRSHLYEGKSARETTALIRLFHRLGTRKVVLTNAAGCICPDFEVGRWMVIRDHINLTGASPLLGSPEFVDMTEVYTAAWADLMIREACELAIPLHEGVYAAVSGPQYETPAEVRMLRTLGADAVGMSTALEAIQARSLGMEVCGLSCLTNWAAGLQPSCLSHEEVLETGKKAVDSLRRLLISVLPKTTLLS